MDKWESVKKLLDSNLFVLRQKGFAKLTEFARGEIDLLIYLSLSFSPLSSLYLFSLFLSLSPLFCFAVFSFLSIQFFLNTCTRYFLGHSLEFAFSLFGRERREENTFNIIYYIFER